MALSSELVSQFVKATKDEPQTKTESTVYGTICEYNGEKYVQLDGSELLTPISATAEADDGERVTVTIKNHTAIVNGNLTSPAARNESVRELSNKISEFEIIIADKVSVGELEAEVARIAKLKVEELGITGKLEANEASIKNLEADNATINEKLTATEGEFEKLEANVAEFNEATVKDLKATNAKVNNLEASYGEFRDLTTDHFEANDVSIKELEAKDVNIEERLTANEAVIETLDTKYATIEQLDTTNANVENLDADVADINTLMFGSASGTVLQTEFANAVIAQLGNAQIKSAMIDSVSASQIKAGDILTNNVRVLSEDGKLLISDETIQISDDNRVRVQIGKDASNDYSINIWDAEGNLMFSQGGITDKAIKDAIIRNDMVSENANISASKLDINSLFEEINGSEKTIKSTKIYLDDKEQTLDVAFTEMTTDLEETSNTVSSQGTAIGVIQGQINSKVWQQDITEATKDLVTNTEMTTKYSELEQTIDGFKMEVSETTTSLQNQIDGAIQTFTGSAVPTLSNYPADDWTDTATRNQHIGDLFYVETEGSTQGFCYRFQLNNGTYEWVLLKDSEITKAIKEAEEANAAAAAVANNLSTNYSTTTQMNSAINQKANEITSTVAATYTTKTEFNNLEIGGRNLIRNSDDGYLDDFTAYNKTDVTYSDDNGWRRMDLVTQLNSELAQQKWVSISEPGTYTFSILCKTDGTISRATVSFFNQLGEHRSVVGTITNVSDNLYKIQATRTIESDVTRIRVVDIVNFITVNATYVMFRYPKLEKGNKATDWTPAPEDIETRMDSAETKITQNSESITSVANRTTTVENKFANYSTTAQMNSAIEQKANAITSSVSSTYTTKADFNALEVGGTNLIRRSAELQGAASNAWQWSNTEATYRSIEKVDGENYYKCTIERSGLTANAHTQFGYWYRSATGPIVSTGETYTCSVWYYCDSSVTVDERFGLSVQQYNSSAIVVKSEMWVEVADIVYDKWTRISVTSTISSEDVQRLYLVFNLYRNGKVSFTKPKLERGNKATDWTPAPEDNLKNLTGRNLVLGTGESKSVGKIDNQAGNRKYTLSPLITDDPKAFLLSLKDGGALCLSYDIDASEVSKYSTATSITRIGVYYTFTIQNISTGGMASWYGHHSGPNYFTDTNTFNPRNNYNSLASVTETVDAPGSYEGHYACYSVPSNSGSLTNFYANPDNYTVTVDAVNCDFWCKTSGATISNVKLEVGNAPTEWSPAPEDIDADIANAQAKADNATDRIVAAETVIQQLSDNIVTLVTDADGNSYMQQTSTGWTFATSQIQNTVDATSDGLADLVKEMGDVDASVDTLKKAVDDLGILTNYVNIIDYEGEPCIELGQTDNDFKLRITNTRIMFVEGNGVPAYMNNQSLFIEKATIENELEFGNFVWKARSNGNFGLTWKG